MYRRWGHFLNLVSLSCPADVAVDRTVVVRDLDNTISSLFSYLSTHSPKPCDDLPGREGPDGDTNLSPFIQVAGSEASSRSHLITPPGSFHAISAHSPPPLPERGPPSEAARIRNSTVSPSPSLSHWLAGHPGPSKDRKSVISSKASSDIELVNLCRSERVRDTGFGGSLQDGTSSREGRDTASDGVPGGQYPPSVREPRRSDKAGPTRHQDSGQCQQDAEAETNARLVSTSHSQPRQGPAGRVLDHHYSEIDIYEAANNTDTTTRTASASLSTSSAEASPPPVPPHLTGKPSYCLYCR